MFVMVNSELHKLENRFLYLLHIIIMSSMESRTGDRMSISENDNRTMLLRREHLEFQWTF